MADLELEHLPVRQPEPRFTELNIPWSQTIRPHHFTRAFGRGIQDWDIYTGAAAPEVIEADIVASAQFYLDEAQRSRESLGYDYIASGGMVAALAFARERVALAQHVYQMPPTEILRISTHNDATCDACVFHRHCREAISSFEFDLFTGSGVDNVEAEEYELNRVLHAVQQLGYIEGIDYIVRRESIPFTQKDPKGRLEQVQIESPVLYMMGYVAQHVAQYWRKQAEDRQRWFEEHKQKE